MTTQEKKLYLQEYAQMNQDMSQKLMERERIASIAEKCTPTFSATPHGGRCDRADIYTRLVEIDCEIAEMAPEYRRKRGEIEAAINAMEDGTLSKLMRCRYVWGYSWQQTAERIGRTVAMTKQKLHKRAIERITLN